MYRSSEPAVLVVQFSQVANTVVSTPLIQYGINSTDANIYLSIIGPTGLAVVFGYLTTFPQGGVSIVKSNVAIQVTLDPSIFVAGVWYATVFAVDSKSDNRISEPCQWGGTVDLLCQGAADATNAYGDTQAIKQATLGACTFDPATGYVTFTSSGDHFRLIDSNGAAVSSPQNATGRDNTTQ